MQRNEIAEYTKKYIGVVQGTAQHKAIIDGYNQITPLPRGYKVKTSDAWCATFVSFVFSKFTKNFPFECSCSKMLEKAKTQGIFVENDDYTPNIGDVILYDWDDGGKNDCVGSPDHVGIVTNINENTITVIEGNKNKKVDTRTIQINGRYIRGYITPIYNVVYTPDNSADDWAAEAWTKATTAGVMDGTNPRGPVTRQMLAVILHRLGEF